MKLTTLLAPIVVCVAVSSTLSAPPDLKGKTLKQTFDDLLPGMSAADAKARGAAQQAIGADDIVRRRGLAMVDHQQMIAMAVEAVGVALSATWLSTPSVILSAVLFGGTFMGITALGLVAARIMSNGGARSAIAGMTVALSVGQILGPSFAGLVHDQTGSFLLPSLGGAAALLVAAALCWFAAGRHN